MKSFLWIFLFFICHSVFISAQKYSPAVDYAGLMDLRFYNESGGFMIETLPIVFPPSNDKKIEFEIVTANGNEKYKTDLRLNSWDNIKVFSGLSANGPGIVHLKEQGDFVINIKVDGEVVTRLPFKMISEESDDPYNPKTNYLREGPWKNLAFFSYDSENEDQMIRFNWWTNLREIPGNNKKAKVTVHIMSGNSEIARSQSAAIVSYRNWQRFSNGLVHPDKKNTNPFTLSDLTKSDGNYSAILKADDKIFKTYLFSVSNGKIDELPQNDLAYSPHQDFIAPRVLDMSSRSNSSYKILNANWVLAK